MNGGQDLGGMMGFGPINPGSRLPIFHADWERRIFALTLAMGATGSWNIDTSRHARESIDPGQYLTLSYYQIWLEGLEKLIVQTNLADHEEISTGIAKHAPAHIDKILQAADVATVLKTGGPANRPPQLQARFKVGDHVRTINTNPRGHTRLARYLRAHQGEIIHRHGVHVFPDASAHGNGEDPQWLYTIRFSARKLWGEAAKKDDFVHADLWQPYLEPVNYNEN